MDMRTERTDIVMIVETWFSKKQLNNDLNLDGYTLFRRDRVRRKGGGLCVYVRDCIPCEIIQLDSAYPCSDVEIMWVKVQLCTLVFFVALCYYPPNPIHSVESFVAQLSSGIESVISNYADVNIVVAGDFNSLCTDFLTNNYGLWQLVDKPTHGSKTIDKFFISCPDIYNATVYRSLVKTKHMAVLVRPTSVTDSGVVRRRQKVMLYDLRAHNIDHLRFMLGTYNWTDLTAEAGIDDIYKRFLSVVRLFVTMCVPRKSVAMSPRDPSYVTPLIKSLLIKRNKLRRKGNSAAADKIAERVNSLITDFRSRQYMRLANANAKELWVAVKGKSSNLAGSHKYSSIMASPDLVNQFFAAIATADDYDLADIINLRNILPPDDFNILNNISFSELDIEPLLRKMKNTAAGYDNIPCWVYRTCSFELAGVVANIINYSFRTGIVPTSWLTAIVTPVPKVSNPSCIADFRPISVTPLLSRITEKLLVRYWLRPALAKIDLRDQFAFKPTGSTNCALIDCFDYVSRMLESNNYVRCMLIDFSKAFDIVSHGIVIRKLNLLDLPASIKNWVISFLTGRTQITRIFDCFSGALPINRSIVQGSGVGPSLYILMESDLRPISINNFLFKFADDTNLLVPEQSDITMKVEFENVQDWARRNKMIINFSKTKEIVFHRPHPSKFSLLPTFDNIAMVRQAKLLGILFSDNLSFESHVNAVLCSCSQRFYLLKMLRDGGMSTRNLNVIYDALIVNRISYCLSAWGGFLNSEQIGRLNALLNRAKKYNLTDNVFDLSGLLLQADRRLFEKMQSEWHCLHHRLPPVKTGCQALRERRHNFVLPFCHFEMYKRSFLPRVLYAFL